MGYMGSEEFIRLQFEEYLLSLISSVKYHIHIKENQNDPRSLLADVGKYDLLVNIIKRRTDQLMSRR